MAWELFALRDHALDVMYSLIFEGRHVPRETTLAILTLLEAARGCPCPRHAVVEEWRVESRRAVHRDHAGRPEDRPFRRRSGRTGSGGWPSSFAGMFERHDDAAGRIGADEYDKAAKQFFPLCKQLPRAVSSER